jgi:hypothetical protein
MHGGKGAPTSYHTELEDNDDAFIGAAFKDSRHIGAASDHRQHSARINNHQHDANLEQTTSSGTNATNETTGFPQYNQIESHMWSFLPNSSDMNSSSSYTHNTTTSLNNVYYTHNNELIDNMAAAIGLASPPHQDDLFGVKRYTQEEKAHINLLKRTLQSLKAPLKTFDQILAWVSRAKATGYTFNSAQPSREKVLKKLYERHNLAELKPKEKKLRRLQQNNCWPIPKGQTQ